LLCDTVEKLWAQRKEELGVEKDLFTCCENLFYAYYKYHINEARLIAEPHVTALAYYKDIFMESNDQYANYPSVSSDEYFDAAGLCSQLNVVQQMLEPFKEINISGINKATDNVFKIKPTGDIISIKPNNDDGLLFYIQDLEAMIDSMAAWGQIVSGDYTTYEDKMQLAKLISKWMSRLFYLHIYHLQACPNIVTLLAPNYQAILRQNLELIQKYYVENEYDGLISIQGNEYQDLEWMDICHPRSEIASFNEMFYKIGRLQDAAIVDLIFCNIKTYSSFNSALIPKNIRDRVMKYRLHRQF